MLVYKESTIGLSRVRFPSLSFPYLSLVSKQSSKAIAITMKFQLLSTLAAMSTLALPTQAATWYFLRYYSASGQKFTELSGEMVVPTLPSASVYYLWPGLQPTDNSGVYQNVLDGRSGTWWFGSGWCCSNPSLPWGGGFNTYEGETIKFENVLQGDNWVSTTTHESTGTQKTDNFALCRFPFS